MCCLANSASLFGQKFWECRFVCSAQLVVKADKHESRFLVVSKFRLFFVQGKNPATLKLDKGFNLLALRSLQLTPSEVYHPQRRNQSSFRLAHTGMGGPRQAHLRRAALRRSGRYGHCKRTANRAEALLSRHRREPAEVHFRRTGATSDGVFIAALEHTRSTLPQLPTVLRSAVRLHRSSIPGRSGLGMSGFCF